MSYFLFLLQFKAFYDCMKGCNETLSPEDIRRINKAQSLVKGYTSKASKIARKETLYRRNLKVRIQKGRHIHQKWFYLAEREAEKVGLELSREGLEVLKNSNFRNKKHEASYLQRLVGFLEGSLSLFTYGQVRY
jgi:hypothetical protein